MNLNYVAPQIEVVEMELEGVLCASGTTSKPQSENIEPITPGSVF